MRFEKGLSRLFLNFTKDLIILSDLGCLPAYLQVGYIGKHRKFKFSRLFLTYFQSLTPSVHKHAISRDLNERLEAQKVIVFMSPVNFKIIDIGPSRN